MAKISEELKPVLKQLQDEGFKVYTYSVSYEPEREINSLYWFENGRILNIQPSSWRHERYARDRFNIGVSYIPSRENGSGCGLSDDDCGTSAENLLKYRKSPTWVRGIINYESMENFLKRESNTLKFYEIETL